MSDVPVIEVPFTNINPDTLEQIATHLSYAAQRLRAGEWTIVSGSFVIEQLVMDGTIKFTSDLTLKGRNM